jgi:hypothetical protein
MEKRVIKRYEYELVQLLAHSEEASVYLAKRKDRVFSYREYRTESAYNKDLGKYKKIQKIGVNVQKLIAHDRQLLVLIFERFQEPTALDVLASEDLKEIYFKQLFTIYRFCRFSKLELNYMPNNYVLKGTTLYYVGEDVTESDPSRNLENFGLRYWIYSKEAAELLEETGHSVDLKRIISEEETNKRIVLLSVTYW